MKEQLITFPTAKLAKEKGFDIKCDHIQCIYSSDGDFDSIYDYVSHTPCEEEIEFYIPTQSLLQKWLREKHNISLSCRPHINNNKLSYSFSLYIAEKSNINFNIMTGYEECGSFKTYEEALEKGLQEALKLIQ